MGGRSKALTFPLFQVQLKPFTLTYQLDRFWGGRSGATPCLDCLDRQIGVGSCARPCPTPLGVASV